MIMNGGRTDGFLKVWLIYEHDSGLWLDSEGERTDEFRDAVKFLDAEHALNIADLFRGRGVDCYVTWGWTSEFSVEDSRPEDGKDTEKSEDDEEEGDE